VLTAGHPDLLAVGSVQPGLFHTTAQVAAAWHPLAEQIAELPWSLTGPAWQVGLTCSQKDPVGGLVMARMYASSN
jgi:hypothetical protein